MWTQKAPEMDKWRNGSRPSVLNQQPPQAPSQHSLTSQRQPWLSNGSSSTQQRGVETHIPSRSGTASPPQAARPLHPVVMDRIANALAAATRRIEDDNSKFLANVTQLLEKATEEDAIFIRSLVDSLQSIAASLAEDTFGTAAPTVEVLSDSGSTDSGGAAERVKGSKKRLRSK